MKKEVPIKYLTLYRVVFISELNLRVDRNLALPYRTLKQQVPKIVLSKFNNVKCIEAIEWLGECLVI